MASVSGQTGTREPTASAPTTPPKTKAKKARAKTQAFIAPKNKKTKAIIAQNSQSSPLLRLPVEIRQKIWGYALGDRMIHIQYENWEYSRHGVFTVKTVSHLRCFHEICQADVTELQAYEYSKSEDYEKAVTTNQKPDLRNADVRHKTCYRNLTAAQNVGAQGPGGLDLRILRVSRQIYVEANPVLWGTTTWSFRRNDHFRRWAEARNAFQRRLIKKVHLCDNRSFLRVIPKSVIMLFKKTFDVVYLNIEDWNARSSLEDFFTLSAKKFTVICLPSSFNSPPTTWAERVELAENLREHLLSVREKMEEKERNKRKALQNGDKKTKSSPISNESNEAEAADERDEDVTPKVDEVEAEREIEQKGEEAQSSGVLGIDEE